MGGFFAYYFLLCPLKFSNNYIVAFVKILKVGYHCAFRAPHYREVSFMYWG